MPDDADARLNNADFFFREGDVSRAIQELAFAAETLAADGSRIFSSVSASEFENPVFTILRSITSVFENIPDMSDIQALLPELQEKLPVSSASPAEILAAVRDIYSQATGDADTGCNDDVRDSDSSSAPKPSLVIEMLIALLSGQQAFRDMLFADCGIYDSAASSAAPYLAGFFVFRGEEGEFAVHKVDSMLFGPVKRISELFYSLLTSSLTAGLLLLVIRRAIPVMQPSNAKTAVDAVILTVSNIPEMIEGLRAVAAELSALKEIIRGDVETVQME